MYNAYKEAGVDIDSGNKFVNHIKSIVSRTHSKNVISGIGGFNGIFSLEDYGLSRYNLVASTDGVGNLSRIARIFNRLEMAGVSIVNHCINDLIAVGATPLFFLDYLATSKLNTDILSKIVSGMSSAAMIENVSIIGGETAEMPKVYSESEIDIVGFILGIVSKNYMITGNKIKEGDLIIGLPSDGVHTNGYSLVDKLLSDGKLDEGFLRNSIKPHRCYRQPIDNLLKKTIFEYDLVTGIAHITGGGFDNILRVIPNHLSVEIKACTWNIPEIFLQIQRAGNINYMEMFKIFNMGIGMVLIINARFFNQFINNFDSDWYLIGKIVKSSFNDHKKWTIV